jgi:hypothetical protein
MKDSDWAVRREAVMASMVLASPVDERIMQVHNLYVYVCIYVCVCVYVHVYVCMSVCIRV